jgi:fumarate hydratase class II
MRVLPAAVLFSLILLVGPAIGATTEVRTGAEMTASGNDATITLGGLAGNYELNVMMPVMAP